MLTARLSFCTVWIYSLISHVAQARLQSDDHFFYRAARNAHHAVIARAQQAHVLARDLRLALEGLGPHSQQAQLVRRSQNSRCRLAVQVTPDGRPSSSSSNGTTSPGSTSSHKPSPTSSSSSSPFKLMTSYTGNDFFNKWDFWEGGDPTHGTVNYLSLTDAKNEGLAFVNNNGNFVMQVDTTPIVPNGRKSVRIQTQASFNGGLLLMDAAHMPTGCGTWPAWWSNGPDWPQNGEIDIVEGVNDYTDNQATVHTRSGCKMPSSFSSSSSFSQVASGQLVGGTNCAAAETNNQGCGVRVLDSTSFGSGFNGNGGGVYAMLWDDTGIAVYFFPRDKIPSDVASGIPNPTAWGLPAAKWPSSSCDPFSFFVDHVAIFDTTLCGDWAGSAWATSGIPGQEQSCAEKTGESSCESYVLNNGASFKEAYWEVSYVKLYQT